MRVHIQRVSGASVHVSGRVTGKIGTGLLLLVAATKGDNENLLYKLAEKCLNLRIFNDEQGKMDLSVKDIHGGLLVVSNFTLYGDCKKGNRPNFMDAAPGMEAEPLYIKFVELLKESGLPVETGRFGAEMSVELINYGPVTVLVEG
jgi:D-tyrosyl-tRNA(Tyr) deacylase